MADQLSKATDGRFSTTFSSLTDNELISLAKRLQSNRSLKVLDISGTLGDEGAKAVARMLQVNKGIATLTFYQHGVGSAGGIALADSLKQNNTLSRLHVSVREPSDAFVDALVGALAVNTSLAELYLDAPLSSAQIQRLAQGLKQHPAMSELFITGKIDGAATRALEEAFADSKNLTKIVTDEQEYDGRYDLSRRAKVSIRSEKLEAVCKRTLTEVERLLEKIDEPRLNPLDIAKAQERLPAIMMVRGESFDAGKRVLQILKSEAERLQTHLDIPYTYRQAYFDEAPPQPAQRSWLGSLRWGGDEQRKGS